MKKLLDGTVIMCAIMNINREEIDIEELLMYIKKISMYLRKKGYSVKNIDKFEISHFFRSYVSIGSVEKDKVFVKLPIRDRVKKFFFSNIDEKILNNIRENNKYIIPLIVEDKFINISFISNDELLESLRSEFYYDSIKNKGYLIDLGRIKENGKYNSIIYFLESFLEKEKVLKKEEINYKDLTKLFELSYSIRNNDFNGVEEKFGLNFNKISSMYEILFYYLQTANNNKINLEYSGEVKIIDKLTK